MSFWEQFSKLCDATRKSPNAVAKDIGISSGSITAWKNGRVPFYDTIERLAKYFNVPVSYFYDENFYSNLTAPVNTNIKKTPVDENVELVGKITFGKNPNELNEFEKDLLDIYRKLPTKEKNALLSKAYELSEKL